MIALHRTASAARSPTRTAHAAGSVLLVAFLLAILAGCGGGGGGDTAASGPGSGTSGGGAESAKSEIPAAALASVDGLLGWMRSWVGTGNDGAQPMVVGSAQLPVDDRASPVQVR